jgi:hypothetical protein
MTDSPLLQGSIVGLLTPMTPDEKINFPAFERLASLGANLLKSPRFRRPFSDGSSHRPSGVCCRDVDKAPKKVRRGAFARLERTFR